MVDTGCFRLDAEVPWTGGELSLVRCLSVDLVVVVLDVGPLWLAVLDLFLLLAPPFRDGLEGKERVVVYVL